MSKPGQTKSGKRSERKLQKSNSAVLVDYMGINVKMLLT